MKKNDIEAMKLEAVRQAELSRTDLDLSDEFDAAIYSMWYLLDPMNLGKRESVGTASVCREKIDEKRAKNLRFTAHAHHNEPITASPDDRLLYARLERISKKYIHFITDRFRIFRIHVK